MFLPLVLTPEPVRYSLEVNKPSSARDPYTQELLRKGYLDYDNWKADKTVVPGPDIFSSDPEPNNPSAKPYKSSASGLTSTKVAEVDYINAELAKHYGMNTSTAYQEALSNTSYQRAVKDMKAAGLNPSVLFGSGRAQSASSSIYASESSSGSGYSGRSGSTSSGKLFSGSAYSAISSAVGIAAAVASKNPNLYWVGSQVAQGAMGLMDAVSKMK